ncbi:Polypeptide deformylase [Bartonella sp. AR 15-3]|nr:Polypeptide deformylase [Bartonella sp. AR 15-3]
MSIKPLVILPDPILREVSKPVEHIDPIIQKLADDMLETMYNAQGVGLAAVQVGIPLRMLVVDISPKMLLKIRLLLLIQKFYGYQMSVAFIEKVAFLFPNILQKLNVPNASVLAIKIVKENKKKLKQMIF